MIKIPATEDILQSKKKLDIPEIRVWCHPERINKKGEDYYYVFDSFKDAIKFISKSREAEDVPLIAFRGLELNIFELK